MGEMRQEGVFLLKCNEKLVAYKELSVVIHTVKHNYIVVLDCMYYCTKLLTIV